MLRSTRKEEDAENARIARKAQSGEATGGVGELKINNSMGSVEAVETPKLGRLEKKTMKK